MFKNLVMASAMSLIALVGVSTESKALTLDFGNTLVDANVGDGLVGDGGNYDALSGGFYGASFTTADAAGNAVFNFINNTASSMILSIADLSAVQSSLTNFFTGGVQAWWIGEEGNAISIAQGVAGGVNGLSTLIAAGGIKTLVVSFGDPVKNGSTNSKLGFQVAVNSSVVPVPAALPLLASGLLGMGLLGRRRKAAKAV